MNELHASETVAAKVKEKRQELRWSMRELAERSGIPEDRIEAIENGRRRRGVTVDELMILAHALKLPGMLLLPRDYDYFTDEEKQRADAAEQQRQADAPRRAAEWQTFLEFPKMIAEGMEPLSRLLNTLSQMPPGAVIAVERDGKLVPVE